MIMIDQSKRLSQPLRWTRSGRLAVGAVAAAFVAAVAVVAVIASTGSSLRRGCIEVTFPSTLGAAVTRQCDGQARQTCASPRANPGLAAHGALRAACLRAGLKYGPS
jgi:hypothetical protein